MKTLGLLLSLATLSLAMTPLEAAPPGEGRELVISDEVNGATADLDRKKSAATDYDFNAMLQPVPATAKFSDPDFNIWCGSAIKGDDGKFHLFYSRWPRKLGHLAWVTHSEIAHAVSDSPFGPWKHHDVALPARGTNFWDGSCTHNPTVIRIGGKFYLYYMGNYGDGVVGKSLNWTHRNHQRIGVAVADSPNGPWTRFDKPSGGHDARFLRRALLQQSQRGRAARRRRADGLQGRRGQGQAALRRSGLALRGDERQPDRPVQETPRIDLRERGRACSPPRTRSSGAARTATGPW